MIYNSDLKKWKILFSDYFNLFFFLFLLFFFFILFIFLVLLRLLLDIFFFSQKPFLSSHLLLLLLFLLDLFDLVFLVKLLLPYFERFLCDRREGRKFGSFKNFFNFFFHSLLWLIKLAFNQVLVDPGTSLFNDIIDDRSISILIYDVLYFVGYGDEVVPCNASKRLNLVFERSFGVILGKFKHDVDLVLKLISNIGFAQDVELLRSSFFDYVKLIQVNAWKGFEFVILTPNTLNISHLWCWIIY